MRASTISTLIENRNGRSADIFFIVKLESCLTLHAKLGLLGASALLLVAARLQLRSAEVIVFKSETLSMCNVLVG